MKSYLAIILIVFAIVAVVPLPAQAFSLVPCGRDEDDSGAIDPEEQCDLWDLFTTISRMINYLVSVAGVVAVFYVINAGFGLVFALGNPEKIQSNKTAIANAVVGLGLVVLSFVFINLLVNGIFGKSPSARQWWNTECLFSFNQAGCPLNQPNQ